MCFGWVDGSIDPRVDPVALECAAGGSNIKKDLRSFDKYSEAFLWPMEGRLTPQDSLWGCQIVALLKS